jgi:hypothetical protein
MSTNAAAQVLPPDPSATWLGLGGAPPASGVRRLADTVEQASHDLPLEPDDEPSTDELLDAAFRLAVAKADADVGLLHRRTDAYLYTTAVHRLDAGMHLLIGLSLWDPAVMKVMQGRSVTGSSQDDVETATVARRLENGVAPRFVLAIPVMIGDCVEALIELGRMDAPFEDGMERGTLASVHAILT